MIGYGIMYILVNIVLNLVKFFYFFFIVWINMSNIFIFVYIKRY